MTTGAQQRPRGRCSWCALKGERRRGNGARRRQVAPLLNGAVGSGGRGDGGPWHSTMCGRRGMGGLVPNGGWRPNRSRPGGDTRGRRGAVWTGERRGPLTHGPQPVAGGGGREEERGRVGQPGGKGSGPSRKEQGIF
jgi:hypothetical protein